MSNTATQQETLSALQVPLHNAAATPALSAYHISAACQQQCLTAWTLGGINGLSAGLAIDAAQPDPGASTIVAAGYGHSAITVCAQKHLVRMGEQQLKSSPFIRTKRCVLMKKLLRGCSAATPRDHRKLS